MFRQIFLASTFTVMVSAQAEEPLAIKVYNAPESSFHVNAVVVYGEKEAMVIDSGFTKADAYRIAANVLDSGKTLKTILISNADPDFYFGAEVLKRTFPDAQIVAAKPVVDKIKQLMPKKVSFWGPKMGENGPIQPILPTALTNNTLTVDGQKVEIKGTTGLLAHRPYVWIPSIKTITGALGVFGNLHVWTADTQSSAERKAWLTELNEMLKLNPKVVVPGHMAEGTSLNSSSIKYTYDYLEYFNSELSKTKNSDELIKAMRKAYPKAGLNLALELGAKVNKGEMKW